MLYILKKVEEDVPVEESVPEEEAESLLEEPDTTEMVEPEEEPVGDDETPTTEKAKKEPRTPVDVSIEDVGKPKSKKPKEEEAPPFAGFKLKKAKRVQRKLEEEKPIEFSLKHHEFETLPQQEEVRFFATT